MLFFAVAYALVLRTCDLLLHNILLVNGSFAQLQPLKRRALRNTHICVLNDLVVAVLATYSLSHCTVADLPNMTPIQELNLQLMIGFLMYDAVHCVQVEAPLYGVGDVRFLFAMVHHVVGSISQAACLYTGRGGGFFAWVHLTEWSTVFLHTRTLLKHFGAGALPTKLAGIAFVLLFFALRVVSVPALIYCMHRAWWAQRDLYVCMQIGTTVFFLVLNLGWAHTIVGMLLRGPKKAA